ncbi:hypothetical protein [Selenihalanaerobacter shriftii]|uniref:Uncharacterized protein n=1 Tax=Selenihalanaerobacter shriftii TaxID=142842 RepID=A0A1T4PNT6_9FIRM|nr:hypothetical protein [Selenihalanaerobacter shriftii]SJZ93203.1 hypothetical protein SAMN02745118_02254 [Selenihalanaerobacter shriftii]
MDKQKIIILVLAVVLLAGLIATKQSSWTPGKKQGVPMEEVVSNSGGNQQGDNKQDKNQKDQQDNPHAGDNTDTEKSPHEQISAKIETNEAGFPKNIGGLKLVKFLSGQNAIKSIEDLHGTTIDVTNGYVATYGEGDHMVEIWVSEAKSVEAATKQIEVMTEKITNNSDVFMQPSAFQISGIKFFQTKGMGMNNYYYQKGKKAYWISVKGVKEAEVMGLIFRVL